MQLHSKTLNNGNSLVITRADGAQMISIEPNAGSSATFLGSLPFQGQNPSPIVLDANQILTISSTSPTSPLDGVTITCTSGTVDIVVGV
jgi:hypothetical protein